MSASPTSTFSVVGALRRFWWVVVVVTGLVAGAAVWGTQFAAEQEYTAEAQYIVPIRTGQEIGPSRLPRAANEAVDAAETYAAVLETDAALLSALALRAGITPADLEQQMTASVIDSTPVVTVAFRSTDEAGTLGFFSVLTSVLLEGATANIPPGNLVPLQTPQSAETAGWLPPLPVLGVIAGLLLGLAVALLSERLDARVRSAAELRRVTGHPVVDLTGTSDDSAGGVLAMRTLRLAGDIADVAVVGVRGAAPSVTQSLAERLSRANERLTDPAGGEPVARAAWHASGVLTPGGAAELTVQRADATVIAVPTGSRLKAVERALDHHGQLSAAPAVLAVVQRPSRRGSRDAPPPQGPAAGPHGGDGSGGRAVPDLAAGR